MLKTTKNTEFIVKANKGKVRISGDIKVGKDKKSSDKRKN